MFGPLSGRTLRTGFGPLSQKRARTKMQGNSEAAQIETTVFDAYRDHYNVQPVQDPSNQAQSGERFCARVDGREQTVSMHDYPEMYRVPFLYDAMMYGMLGRETPFHLARVFRDIVHEHGDDPRTLTMLEVGAGSGAFAEALQKQLPFGPIIGLDIYEEAAEAAQRDRPGVYVDYIVADLCNMPAEADARVRTLRPTCVGVASATGWGNHIPVAGFQQAFDYLEPRG